MAEARGRVGAAHVILDESEFTVRFDREGMMIDLGAIGKGYAIDRAVEILREAGIASALLHGGTSTVYGIGRPPGGEGWNVAIAASSDQSRAHGAVTLRDNALSVSAVWGKSFEADGPRSDAWVGSLMHAWNPDLVKSKYPAQRDKWIVQGHDGAVSVRFPENGSDRFDWFGFGWMAVWASEVGDIATAEGLLAHADRHMNPKWVEGSYYYPRNDQQYDAKGNLTACHPHQGNVLLAYA